MFRRAFWFVSGAVSGIVGVAWLKRRARDVRGSLSAGSLLALSRNLLTIAYHRGLVLLAYVDGLVRGAPKDDNPGGIAAQQAVRHERRHIATPRRNSHG